MRWSCALLMALLAMGVPAAAAAADPAPAPSDKPGFTFSGAATARGEFVSDYELDRYGTRQEAGAALAPRVRLGAAYDSRGWKSGLRLVAEAELDAISGTYSLRPAVDGLGMPDSEKFTYLPRKANVKAHFGDKLQVGAGLMTSHWGLGLLANDGAHEWTPGSARFTDPRGGDRVLRAFAATGPFTNLGLVGVLAGDLVWDDDVLLTGADLPEGMDDDKAWQVVAALTAGGAAKGKSAGVYIVHRRQTTADGRQLAVTVFDATGRLKFDVGQKASLALEFETAFLLGGTDLAASPEHPEQPIRQLGVAARATFDAGKAGAVLDVTFASGDQNPDDGLQNAFKADPNYEMGLFLYRHVLSAQSGRSYTTGGDPDLVGVPSQGIERLPNRGSLTNTIAVFPRGFWRPIDSLEIYGGPLIALSSVPLSDPLNTRVAGGELRNATDAEPGLYLGTEVDVGVRWRLTRGMHQVTLGAEGGVLLPGTALALSDGASMPPVMGGRAVLDYRF